ncbi:hypothetical protein [Amycolatopsis japonica]
MRIRSTKPEFWRSARIASVSWDARLVLKGLESYVDDNGVGRDDIALIVGDLFQRDLVREASRTLARVSEAISELCEAGLVWRYEHDGTQLLFLAFWDQVQRVDKPNAGRFPRPDGTMNYKESEIRESLARLREGSRLEQGNRGTGEQGEKTFAPSGRDAAPAGAGAAAPKPEAYSSDFEAAWAAYERRGAKRKAWAEWRKAIKRADPATITQAIPRYLAENRDPRYRLHFERFLSGDKWESLQGGDTGPEVLPPHHHRDPKSGRRIER